MEAHQREALYVTKLSALVGAPAEPVRGGAGAVLDGTAWFLGEDLGVRALGPAFSWADQRGAERLSVIVPRDVSMSAVNVSGACVFQNACDGSRSGVARGAAAFGA